MHCFIRDLFILSKLRRDSITGFYQRTYYDMCLKSKIEKRIKKGEKFFCIFGDFNFLKYANGLYGYDKVNKSIKLICDIIAYEVK